MAAVALMPEMVFGGKTEEPTDAAFSDLLHDLRQPLSSIEAIAYYLEMTIPAQFVEARAMLLKLQDIVQDAGGILERAETRRLLSA